MNTAEQILDKHLELRSWNKTVPKNGNLYNTLIDALNEALSIADVVGRSKQFTPKQLYTLAQRHSIQDFQKILKEAPTWKG